MGEIIVGVISDTHGLLRPEAVDGLRGSELIIHAGDVGSPAVIDELRRLAPTHVVRGNIDKAGWAAALPMTALVEVGGLRFSSCTKSRSSTSIRPPPASPRWCSGIRISP